MPLRMTMLVAASVFVVEFAIMLALPAFHLSPTAETFIDATTLLLVTIPVLLKFVLRPLTAEVAARQAAEASLRDANAQLEARISERTRELSAALGEAAQAARAKDSFLASMSHEIRTPLNAVIGMTELLQSTPLTPEQREFARTAYVGGQSLLAVVNDILDFSKLQAGKVEFEARDFDPTAILEECARLAAVKADEKRLTLIAAVSPEMPGLLRGDEQRLRQVVMNLLNNAVKFTDKGCVVLRAKPQTPAAGTGGTVRFEVEDTGIGVAPEVAARLFQAFTQADASMTRRYGGTGLGLAISRKIVEGMRGRIGVESTLGAGSVFWFEAPFEAAIGEAATRAAPLSGRSFLLVDPQKLSRDALRERLEAWGARCSAHPSAPEGLALLRSPAGEAFTTVLVDVSAPGAEPLAAAARAGGRALVVLGADRPEDSVLSRGDARLRQPVTSPELLSALLVPAGSAPARAAQAPATAAPPAPAPAPAPAAAPAGPGGASPRVLVVEDNSVNRLLTRTQLKRLGVEADLAENGRAALKILAERRYDLVLMDCHMPEMDGFEATAEIRRAEASGRARVPIVAMTADAMTGDRERCIAAGMDDYLSKPVSLAPLSRVVERWIGGVGDTGGIAVWTPDYSVGVEALDEQHRGLFDTIAHLHRALRERRGNSALAEVLARMAEYTRVHFTTEETLLQDNRYPALPQHRAEHERFVAAVRGFEERLRKGEPCVTLDTLNYLQDWLLRHILDADKKYARFLADRGAAGTDA